MENKSKNPSISEEKTKIYENLLKADPEGTRPQAAPEKGLDHSAMSVVHPGAFDHVPTYGVRNGPDNRAQRGEGPSYEEKRMAYLQGLPGSRPGYRAGPHTNPEKNSWMSLERE